MNNINLTPIIEAIIMLLAALITSKLIPWINAKTTNEQQQYIAATIKTLVFAAEQLYGTGNGEYKLEYVKNALEAKGFTVDRAQIEAVIKENLFALHYTKPTELPAEGE